MSDDNREEYTANQEFNDEFDSENPEIRIGNLPPYKASLVLYNVDYDAYLLAIEEQKQKNEETQKESIYYYFPQPIAYYFHQAENGYSNQNHRLQLLRSTWEAIIFTLYAIVIGEARYKGFAFRNIVRLDADGNPDLVFNDYFSDKLAQKLLVIERILQYSLDKNIPLVGNQLIPLATIQKIRRLNRERNEFMHTAALSEEQASLKYLELVPDVLQVLTDLNELASLEILHYIGNEGAATALKFHLFQGYTLARQNSPVMYLSPAQLGQIAGELTNQNIFAHYRGELFSITPFLHFKSEANGNITNLCYCKRKHSATRYELEIVSRSEIYEDDGTAFADRVNELRGLIT